MTGEVINTRNEQSETHVWPLGADFTHGHASERRSLVPSPLSPPPLPRRPSFPFLSLLLSGPPTVGNERGKRRGGFLPSASSPLGGNNYMRLSAVCGSANNVRPASLALLGVCADTKATGSTSTHAHTCARARARMSRRFALNNCECARGACSHNVHFIHENAAAPPRLPRSREALSPEIDFPSPRFLLAGRFPRGERKSAGPLSLSLSPFLSLGELLTLKFARGRRIYRIN